MLFITITERKTKESGRWRLKLYLYSIRNKDIGWRCWITQLRGWGQRRTFKSQSQGGIELPISGSSGELQAGWSEAERSVLLGKVVCQERGTQWPRDPCLHLSPKLAVLNVKSQVPWGQNYYFFFFSHFHSVSLKVYDGVFQKLCCMSYCKKIESRSWYLNSSSFS